MPSWRSAPRTTSGADRIGRGAQQLLAILPLVALLALPAAEAVAQGAAALPTARSAETLPLWRALDWFVGRWQGQEESSTGEGRALRCVGEILDGRILLTRSISSVMAPDDAGAGRRSRGGDLTRPGLQGHERWQLLARDPDDGRITLDQYDSTGYRSSFVLDADASRPDRYLFRAERIGYGVDVDAGTLEWRIARGERFVETLALAVGEAAPATVAEHRWRRSGDASACAGAMISPAEAFR